MNVDAVADELGVRLRREDDPMPEPVCCGPRHLTGDHRMVGRGQRRLWHYRHFELARTVFGEKSVRDHPGRPQRSNESFSKRALAAERGEGIGVARTIGNPRIEELLLERGDKAKARHFFELADSAAQEIARTAFPGAAVGIADVAKK